MLFHFTCLSKPIASVPDSAGPVVRILSTSFFLGIRSFTLPTAAAFSRRRSIRYLWLRRTLRRLSEKSSHFSFIAALCFPAALQAPAKAPRWFRPAQPAPNPSAYSTNWPACVVSVRSCFYPFIAMLHRATFPVVGIYPLALSPFSSFNPLILLPFTFIFSFISAHFSFCSAVRMPFRFLHGVNFDFSHGRETRLRSHRPGIDLASCPSWIRPSGHEVQVKRLYVASLLMDFRVYFGQNIPSARLLLPGQSSFFLHLCGP